MMKKSALLFIVIIGLFVFQSCSPSAGNLSTGKIKFTDYKVISGQKHINSFITVYFTPKRIRIQGNGFDGLHSGVNFNGLLIRNDKEDIVFFATNNKAVKITKADISSYMNMMGGFMGLVKGLDSTGAISFKKTGKTKRIDGYKSLEFIYTNKMSSQMIKGLPNMHIEIWMTKGLNINWGFLTDIADQVKKAMGLKNNFPPNFIFKDGYFPVLVKQYRDSSLVRVSKAKITAAKDVKSHVQIPSGVKVVSFKQFTTTQMVKSMGKVLDSFNGSTKQ